MVALHASVEPRVEDVDSLPLLGAWTERMKLCEFLDEVLGPPHGNWEGLSPGAVLVGFLLSVVSERDHRVVPVEEWAGEHLETLRHLLGAEVSEKDFTDDRILSVLGQLGEEEARRWEPLERLLGAHLVQAFQLPRETARADTSSFVMYQGEDGLLARFGHSKDRRPDLRQFKVLLGTLDPLGLPLLTEVLAGNEADDGVYVAAWERMSATLGCRDFVFVADCKFASLANRGAVAQREGIYYAPLPRTGKVPEIIQEWALSVGSEAQELRLSNLEEDEVSDWWGLERTYAKTWTEAESGAKFSWEERWCLVRNMARVDLQWEGLGLRLKAAEQELQELGQAPGEAVAEVQERVAQILKQHRVGDYLRVEIGAQARYRKVYEGPGRPGPERPYRRQRYYEIQLRVARNEAQLEEFLQLAGWQIRVTNAPPEQVSLADGVERYLGQWQPERGFHRWKGGELPLVPLYIRDDDRIRGLVVMLGLALRLLTLMEYVVRERLTEEEENTLAGLYTGNRKRATARPTAEKMREAFQGIRRMEVVQPEGVEVYVTPLNALQKRLLKLMGLPETIYTDLARSGEKFIRDP